VVAHRLSWELANGPIPDGLFVLHRCDTPRCVRPEHLFLGTKADNTADMMAKGRQVLPPVREECRNWHAYTPENTYRHKSGRQCISCRRARRAALSQPVLEGVM